MMFGCRNTFIPNSVTSLEKNCFYDCTGLTSIAIPNSVTSLGESCFKGCTGLTSVTIPNSVTSLGYECFEGCTGLTSITIPNSVTLLGVSCFYGCTGLTSVTIGSAVQEVGASCFFSCDSIKTVYCLATDPPYSSEYKLEFFEHKSTKTLYVPEVSIVYYQSARPWLNFGKILPLSTSGVNSVSNDEVEITCDNGTLALSNVPDGMPVRVYSITGGLLGSGKGNISVAASRGQVVIVQAGGQSRKVLVK